MVCGAKDRRQRGGACGLPVSFDAQLSLVNYILHVVAALDPVAAVRVHPRLRRERRDPAASAASPPTADAEVSQACLVRHRGVHLSQRQSRGACTRAGQRHACTRVPDTSRRREKRA